MYTVRLPVAPIGFHFWLFSPKNFETRHNPQVSNFQLENCNLEACGRRSPTEGEDFVFINFWRIFQNFQNVQNFQFEPAGGGSPPTRQVQIQILTNLKILSMKNIPSRRFWEKVPSLHLIILRTRIRIRFPKLILSKLNFLPRGIRVYLGFRVSYVF